MRSLAAALLIMLALVAGAGNALAAQSSVIQSMLAGVSADSLMAHDSVLVRASGYYSRVAYTPGNDSSVQYVYRSLKRYPAVTRAGLDTFFVSDSLSGPYATKPLLNVYAMIRGAKDSMTAVVLGAHLDTYAGRESTWATQWRTIHAPGADDNGTGVSAVLEAARIFANARMLGYVNDYTLIFATFNAEEAGMAYGHYIYGSAHLAARLKAEGFKVAAMINIDMIGFNKNLTADIVSDNPSQPIGQTALQVNAQYGLGLAMNAPPFVYATYSDHSSFWGQGFPAVLMIEHAPPNVTSSNYTINTLYHTSHDTLGALNPELMKRHTQLAIGTAAVWAMTQPSSGVSVLPGQTPAAFALEQNFPNPFNPSTTLRFTVAEPAFVRLTVVDVLGREVAELVREQMQPGSYSVEWNAARLPSGMYVAVMRARSGAGGSGQEFLETKKILMEK